MKDKSAEVLVTRYGAESVRMYEFPQLAMGILQGVSGLAMVGGAYALYSNLEEDIGLHRGCLLGTVAVAGVLGVAGCVQGLLSGLRSRRQTTIETKLE